MARQLNCDHICAFWSIDGAMSGWKPPVEKDVDSLLSWHGSNFRVCIIFCKVIKGDSVTKPDYYIIIRLLLLGIIIVQIFF